MAATINNTSDLGITCGVCGTTFTGRGNYSEEITEMFNQHKHAE